MPRPLHTYAHLAYADAVAGRFGVSRTTPTTPAVHDAAYRPVLTLAVSLAVHFLAGCSLGGAAAQVPAVDIPSAYVNEAGADVGQRAEAAPWWTDFDAPSLTAALEETLEGNLSLEAALLRVEQADTLVRTARSAQLPALSAGLDASRARNPSFGPGASEPTNQLSLSAGASYEVDLWRKHRATRHAAHFDREALADDARALAMTLTARSAEAWLNVTYHRARRTLMAEQLETQEQLLALLEQRLRAGLGSALDIEQQRQQAQALQAELARIDADEATASITLRTLQGRALSAEPVEAPSALPDLPALPALGVPADLLSRRPDVRAAYRRARAADERVTAALAARLPTLRLSASAFLQSGGVAGLFDTLFWNIGAGLAAPLYQGGRLRAEADRAALARDERLALWADTLLVALSEVEEALILEQEQTRYLAELATQIETAERSLALAAQQYQRGVTDYVRVLSAVSALHQLEQTRLAAERQRLSHRVQLYRALGGSWLEEQALPTSEAEGDPA